ncbi:MAG: lysozyme inhibitor LprI family protein [Verrucomicrobiae bacterium]
MDIKHLTSDTLRNLLRITSKKEELIKAVADIENEIAKAIIGAVTSVVETDERYWRMKLLLCLQVGILMMSASFSQGQTPVAPKEWINPESLADVQNPLQAQLDTGKSMLSTVWSMARVKDAELFITYVILWEKLPANERETLFKEQEQWLRQRKKVVAESDDGESGEVGRLQAASEYQSMTEARLVAIKKRRPKK